MNSFEDAKIGIMIAICAVGIICSAIAIYGATYFNKYGVMIGAGWFMLEAVRSLFFLDIGNAIMSTCFFYPHIVFYFELKNVTWQNRHDVWDSMEEKSKIKPITCVYELVKI